MAGLWRVVLVLGWLALGAGRAVAATPEETAQAREHFQKGQAHYDLKEYAAALDEFKSAYRYIQDPVMLYNIAQCHNFLGHNEDALGFYRNYLRRSPAAPNRAAVERKIAELERKLAASRPAGVPPAPAPAPASVTPTPGAAPPGNAPGSNSAAPVPFPVATLSPPPVASAPAASPAVDLGAPPPGEAPRPVWKRWWFWTGVGAVVAAGVVTAVVISKRGEVGDCMGLAPCVKVGGP